MQREFRALDNFVATAGNVSADVIMEYIKEQYFKEAKKNEKG